MEINDLIEQITKEVLQKLQAVQPESKASGVINVLNKIDHTLLKPDATRQEIKKVCDEAKQYGFASVCVNPCYIGYVAEQLNGSIVSPCCVIGFPLGATMPEVKAFETETAIQAGAKEVDMVINIGAVKSGEWDIVKKDIEAVVRASRGRALVKVIIETCLLTNEQKVEACKVAKQAGADFVKTSTGFSKGGATVDDVRLMRETVGPVMGVKASGGVRDYKTAVEMVNAGATRLGTSSGIEISKASQGSSSGCINCGKCSGVCPTGRVSILKSDY